MLMEAVVYCHSRVLESGGRGTERGAEAAETAVLEPTRACCEVCLCSLLALEAARRGVSQRSPPRGVAVQPAAGCRSAARRGVSQRSPATRHPPERVPRAGALCVLTTAGCTREQAAAHLDFLADCARFLKAAAPLQLLASATEGFFALDPGPAQRHLYNPGGN